jgi:hypothetical protein
VVDDFLSPLSPLHLGTFVERQGYTFNLSRKGTSPMKSLIVLVGLATLSVATPTLAAGPINARQINQERLIDAGFRSGKLTRYEVTTLKAEQRSIRRQEDRMRARHGGRLTARDKRFLHNRQDVAERNYARERRDRQRGPNRLKI